MSAVFRLFLIAMLALTSQGLASARGQPRALSELVICAGATVTTITVDERGQPAKRTDFCPDMASQLLAALILDAHAPDMARRLALLPPAIPALDARGREAPAAQARAPPAAA